MPPPRPARWQIALGVFVCVALPLGSWLIDGRGGLAYTMYARTLSYRLEVTALGAGGERHPVELSRVAGAVSSPAAVFIANADAFHTAATIDALRDHLVDVARAACRSVPAEAIAITLYENDDDGNESMLPPRRETVPCRPAPALRR